MKPSEQPRRLDSLGDSIWSIQEPVRFGPLRIRTRMTVVRLDDGALWIHSPLAPAPNLTEALDSLGRVRYVVAPNKSHSLFFESFLAAYPAAEGYAAPGLGRKLGHDRYAVPGRADPFGPHLTPYFIAGLPVLNETVWYHTASRSLILSDLLFCFGEDNQPLMRLVARMLGVYKTLGMSRSMRWATRADGHQYRSRAG